MTQRADGRWTASYPLPGGTYAYKVAIDGSWTENYGAGGVAGGANLAMTVPAAGEVVTFLYDPVTHVVTDNSDQQIVTAVGDFQSELGCGADWHPPARRPR